MYKTQTILLGTWPYYIITILAIIASFIIHHFFFFEQYDDSKAQERLERKIQNAPEGQGTVRMLSREEWEEVQEIRPRTPFESRLARPNARIRTGDPLHLVSII